MKFRTLGAELFRADGRTDVTKLIVAFRKLRTFLKKNVSTVFSLLRYYVYLLYTSAVCMLATSRHETPS